MIGRRAGGVERLVAADEGVRVLRLTRSAVASRCTFSASTPLRSMSSSQSERAAKSTGRRLSGSTSERSMASVP